jgi:hypothetical protein
MRRGVVDQNTNDSDRANNYEMVTITTRAGLDGPSDLYGKPFCKVSQCMFAVMLQC